MNDPKLTEAERNAHNVALWWNSKLTNFRKKHGLTVEDLARLLPAKTQLVADWEDGKQPPPLLLKRALRDLERDIEQGLVPITAKKRGV
jgi:DNA-binding transcriptional regulator YiaG